MRKITYRQHINLCYLFGVKPRNPISFFFWKLFTKDDACQSQKKYTESESILGECKFDEKIHTEPLDLSDAKFIDEDGNVTTPADWQDWNETPPWEESEGNDGNT